MGARSGRGLALTISFKGLFHRRLGKRPEIEVVLDRDTLNPSDSVVVLPYIDIRVCQLQSMTGFFFFGVS